MTLANEIRAALAGKVDAKYLAKIRELVPTASPLLGVRVPDIRALVKPFHTRHPGLAFSEVLGLVDAQFATRCREEMLFGVFLLMRFKKVWPSDLWSSIHRWIDLIDNWEVCDQLAMSIAAPMVARELGLVDALIEWTRSANPWRRRFAVACSAALNQRGRRLAEETLRICAGLLEDGDRSVQKAVGWALREACKVDEGAVYLLLSERRSSIHKRILREGAQKLSPRHRESLGL